MSYLMNDLPTNEDEWDVLWKQIMSENELTTDRECYQFLTQMVLGITGTMAQMDSVDPDYDAFKTFVNLVFEEWTYYDVRLNDYND